MVFKLVESAAKRWHRLRGYQQLPDVLDGVIFQNGVMGESLSSLLGQNP
jgi:hypothetical protein